MKTKKNKFDGSDWAVTIYFTLMAIISLIIYFTKHS